MITLLTKLLFCSFNFILAFTRGDNSEVHDCYYVVLGMQTEDEECDLLGGNVSMTELQEQHSRYRITYRSLTIFKD